MGFLHQQQRYFPQRIAAVLRGRRAVAVHQNGNHAAPVGALDIREGIVADHIRDGRPARQRERDVKDFGPRLFVADQGRHCAAREIPRQVQLLKRVFQFRIVI